MSEAIRSSRRSRSNIAIAVAIALVFGFLGWQGGLLARDHHVSPGESMASTWESQIAILTNAQGEPRAPDDVVVTAHFSMAALTLGLALHYEQIPEEQWQRIEARLGSILVGMPEHARASTAAVIDCILSARRAGSIDRECVRRGTALLR
jgi:hypothetical protein